MDPVERWPMSWRRFAALVSGLSPTSLWAWSHRSEGNVIRDPQRAERAVFDAMGV